MEKERIKNKFCIDEVLILDLKKELVELVKEAKKMEPKLKQLREYTDYVNCGTEEKEDKRLILFDTELGRRFCWLNERRKKIKEILEEELSKVIYGFEFDEINRSVNCDHLYYVTGDGNICLKCACFNKIVNDRLKEKGCDCKSSDLSKRRTFIKDLLKIVLSDDCLSKGIFVSEIVQREDLDYVLKCVMNILKSNPNISNKSLLLSLEEPISLSNLEMMDTMVFDPDDVEDLDEETRKVIDAYKKHL